MEEMSFSSLLTRWASVWLQQAMTRRSSSGCSDRSGVAYPERSWRRCQFSSLLTRWEALASASNDNTIKLWDQRTGQELLTLKGHIRFVSSVAFSPDGKRLASASGGSRIKLWDAATGQELLTLMKEGCGSVVFSPDGSVWLQQAVTVRSSSGCEIN